MRLRFFDNPEDGGKPQSYVFNPAPFAALSLGFLTSSCEKKIRNMSWACHGKKVGQLFACSRDSGYRGVDMSQNRTKGRFYLVFIGGCCPWKLETLLEIGIPVYLCRGCT